jgi:hypothetical protein
MFPAEKLVASGGEIYCHLFENPHTGLARNVYWSIGIEFHPVDYEGRAWPCSMTCEWLTWPIRDWRQLEGQALDLSYGDGGSESSFYLWQHDTGKSTRLRIGPRSEERFEVEMLMVVDFAGYTGSDSNPAMEVRARAVLPYTGVIVVPGNLFPEPGTPGEAVGAVAPYLDTALFKAPERHDHAFRMEPLPGI